MRVLFYHSSRAWTGSARAFATAARGLSERGHTVTFVCEPDSPVEERLEFGAYEVLPMSTDVAWPLAALRQRRALQERGVEVVFVHTEREFLVAAAAARMAGRAAVLRRVAHGASLGGGLRAWLSRRLAPTGALLGSEEERRRAEHNTRARLAPAVVPLGVNAQAYDAVRPASRASIGAGGGARLLACVCDQTSRVRAGHVLRVMEMLAPRHPELRLALLGPGSDSEDLRMHAAALRITKQVSFLGERDDYLSILPLADLGWVVASGDNAVYALLDLLASKVPVLAERGTVAQQVVPDGIAGILLPSGDTPDTAAAIARLLARDEERVAMGNAGRVRVARDFSESAMIEAFERAALAAGDRAQW